MDVFTLGAGDVFARKAGLPGSPIPGLDSLPVCAGALRRGDLFWTARARQVRIRGPDEAWVGLSRTRTDRAGRPTYPVRLGSSGPGIGAWSGAVASSQAGTERRQGDAAGAEINGA